MNELSDNFSQIVVCKLHKEYTYSACPLRSVNKGLSSEAINYVAMKVDKLTHTYISVNQMDARSFSE